MDKPAGTDRVRTFYDKYAEQEWSRADRHPVEFATTWRAIQEYLPPASKVLDVGGGPGRYSIRLAQAGHRVTLLDLSENCVDLARKKAAEHGVAIEGFIHGDALNLSPFPAETFDAILLMGPLYHLTEAADREQAVAQALRVLRSGGLVFAAFITRQAFLVDALKYYPGRVLTYGSLVDHFLETGVSITSGENPGFTDAYFADPMEIEPLMRGFGLETLRIAAAEPLVCLVEQAVNQLPKDAFERWVDLCYRFGTNPVNWGASEHILYVGRKPRSR